MKRSTTRPIWITRVLRVFRPPKCAACTQSTEGGIVCDVCGLKLIDQTRDAILAQSGPIPL